MGSDPKTRIELDMCTYVLKEGLQAKFLLFKFREVDGVVITYKEFMFYHFVVYRKG